MKIHYERSNTFYMFRPLMDHLKLFNVVLIKPKNSPHFELQMVAIQSKIQKNNSYKIPFSILIPSTSMPSKWVFIQILW